MLCGTQPAMLEGLTELEFIGHSTGTTGFDVVGSCERLQVEVPGGLAKHREKPIRADHEFALAA